MKRPSILLLGLLAACAACAKKEKLERPATTPTPQDGDGTGSHATSGSLSGLPYAVLRQALLQLTGETASGEGALLFTEPLPANPASRRFTVGFSLLDGGSLALISYSDAGLERGVSVSFERVGSTLRAVAGGSTTTLADGATADQPLSFTVDVDNGGAAPRLLVHVAGSPVPAWDSMSAGQHLTPGEGDRWGLALKDATVSSVAVGEFVAPQSDGDDDHAVPTTYSVADLLQTARKATARFERMAIPNATFKSVKTWKSETYAWAKLTYRVPTDDGATSDAFLYLACHFHGADLGCHKKDASDPSEPADEAPSDDDLPPLDDDLPPLD